MAEQAEPYAHYRDLVTSGDTAHQRLLRSKEAQRDISLLLGKTSIQPTGFLEIGSGIGGVTKALREDYPTLPIVTMDINGDSLVESSAELHGTTFIRGDASTIDEAFIRQLQEQGINTIVAMRMPGEIILHVLNLISNMGSKVTLIASIIDIPHETRTMRQLAASKNTRFMILREEPRLIREVGYAFPLVEK